MSRQFFSHSPTKSPTKKPTTHKPIDGSPTTSPTKKPTSQKPSSSGGCGDVTIRDDSFTVLPDGSTNLPVLDNDTAKPGSTLTVTQANAGVTLYPHSRLLAHAGYQCEPSSDGNRVKFTPEPGFLGIAVCIYQACDGDCCGTALIFITVSSTTIA